MSAAGPAAVETCPVCGSPMARGHRWRAQMLAERDCYGDGFAPYVWQSAGSTMCCETCAAAVMELLRRLGDSYGD